jgi:hypothetical protein
MKVFQTNAALGYRQLAFLIRLNESANGYDYLCIGTQNIHNNDTYQIGKIVKDLEDFYLEDTIFQITDSELNGTYLFDYWVSHFKHQSTETIEKIEQLSREQLCKAYDILHNGFKRKSNYSLKVQDMKSILGGAVQPCCSFERWLLLIKYLKSIGCNFETKMFSLK